MDKTVWFLGTNNLLGNWMLRNRAASLSSGLPAQGVGKSGGGLGEQRRRAVNAETSRSQFAVSPECRTQTIFCDKLRRCESQALPIRSFLCLFLLPESIMSPVSETESTSPSRFSPFLQPRSLICLLLCSLCGCSTIKLN